MNETVQHAAELAAAGAASGVALSLTGSAFGLQFEVVLLGMLGALIAESFVPGPRPTDVPAWRRMGAMLLKICTAGLFAGLFTKLVEAQASRMLGIDVATLHVGVAAGLGIVAPIAVPLIRGWVSRRSGGGQ